MNNDVANVSTTRGVKGGYVFRAPLGTPLPTDIRTPLNPDLWANVGFVASDGFKEAVDGGSAETITDLNGDVVDTYSEGGAKETLVLKLIEMAVESLRVQYGHKNVETRDGMIVVKHDWSNANETYCYVLELVLKNGRRWRKVVPAGTSGERGEFTGNSTEVAGREVTITYSVDKDGSGCYDYIEIAPGSATGKTFDEMTIDELKKYAADNNIDITGKTTKADILEAIKAVIAATE